ncbi:MAG: DUF3179 domain-containing (seleno)protein [Pseudomonadota bacterium]
MTITFFYLGFVLLLGAELVKGLSANGTPPVLQRFSWQIDLAWFMWTNIARFRVILSAVLLVLLWRMTAEERASVVGVGIAMLLAWYFLYWIFNKFWVGKRKFLPLERPTFAKSSGNSIDESVQIVGVEHAAKQKAYPVAMLFYHHQVPDSIGDLPIWVTYCGMCRSGRVYHRNVDGQALTFSLVGAITYNAVFRDTQTGSWWRQETGEAAKGPMQGKTLEDVPMEQMSLRNWLAKYPDSEILQYDPKFQGKYDFVTSLLNYEASLPGWHMQATPSLIIGLEVGGQARAYDWDELQKRRLVSERFGDTDVLVLSSADGSSAFAYDRQVDDAVLEFEINGDELIDTNTGSKWDIFGRCVSGPKAGAQLEGLQNYKQFVRAWASFHPHTTYYQFEGSYV